MSTEQQALIESRFLEPLAAIYGSPHNLRDIARALSNSLEGRQLAPEAFEAAIRLVQNTFAGKGFPPYLRLMKALQAGERGHGARPFPSQSVVTAENWAELALDFMRSRRSGPGEPLGVMIQRWSDPAAREETAEWTLWREYLLGRGIYVKLLKRVEELMVPTRFPWEFDPAANRRPA